MPLPLALALLAGSLAAAGLAGAAAGNTVVAGSARLTILTDSLVRMEWAAAPLRFNDRLARVKHQVACRDVSHVSQCAKALVHVRPRPAPGRAHTAQLRRICWECTEIACGVITASGSPLASIYGTIPTFTSQCSDHSSAHCGLSGLKLRRHEDEDEPLAQPELLHECVLAA